MRLIFTFIFTFIFVGFMITLHAQTQDSFNLCSGYELNEHYTYLIPNPDFEEFTCCPSGFTQMHCVNNWIQPSPPTTDYMNTCDFVFPAAQAAGLVPFPSGEGITGTIFAADWQEYIAVCLNDPIPADIRLFLKFKIAYTPITNLGGECIAPVHTPVDIVVYGHNDCGTIELNTNGCPMNADPNWEILGKTLYQPLAQWNEMVIEINTIEEVNAIYIGSPCVLPSDFTLQGCIAYFYYDDFSLVGSLVTDKEIMAEEFGHPCSNDYRITTEIDTFGGEWQWFLDGEILAGETNPYIKISDINLPSGVYSVRYILGDYCILYQKEVNLEEMRLIHWGSNIVHDDGNGTGWVEIIIEEERPPYQISWAHGPLTFSISDLMAGDYYATVTDAVGCTISIEVNITISNYPKEHFVTIWNTELSGITANNQISLPGIGTNYTIYWEEIYRPDNRDSTIGNNTTIITFPNPGKYRVSITPGEGIFHRIQFVAGGDKNKIINIIQWGEIEWSSFAGAFKHCLNVNCEAIDLPILSQVTDMSEMFSFCKKLTGPLNIGLWDVSNVTDMNGMFYFASLFNQDIGSWNVANVTNMGSMFSQANSFNQDIGRWNVDKVTNMSAMFWGVSLFNHDIGGWNVANVTDMSSMFSSASKFNQNIEGWNLAKVTDMNRMFHGAASFNQDVGNWNVANVTDMSWVFSAAISFNQDIGNWNVRNVLYMTRMFWHATLFNQNISNWNVANVYDMSSMFEGASSFNQEIGSWNVANVNNMKSMFNKAESFNEYIGGWNVAKVRDMSSMFSGASIFNQNIGTWNVARVNNMSAMFSFTNTFNQDIGNWDVANVEEMISMFNNAKSFNQDIGNWNVSKVTDMRSLFFKASAFNHDIGRWNVERVRNMGLMFSDANSFNHDIGNWNVAKVTDMRNMFEMANIFNQDIGSWNVSNVTDMRNMFNGASSFNQDIGRWDVAKITNMNSMFSSAESFNQDIGNWNVAIVTNMNSMFSNASSFNQNIGTWDIRRVTDMRSMLNESGMECENYSATIMGWSSNPTTPNGRILGAERLEYGIEAEDARANLITSKGWTIEGDNPSGVECLETVSTEEADLGYKIKLFPNPFDNQFVVEISSDEQFTFIIYDQLSRIVVQQSFYKITVIDTEQLPQGLYIYELKQNQQSIRSGKIVKQ